MDTTDSWYGQEMELEAPLIASSSADEPTSPRRARHFPGGRNEASVGRTTKMTLFLSATACCIYLVFLMYSDVAEPPPRPLMYGRGKGNSIKMLKEEKMQCHLPDLKPFDSHILGYIKKPRPVDCSLGHPRVFESDLNRTIIQVADPGQFNYSKCCFQSFQKTKGSDSKLNYSKTCIPITAEKTVINPPIKFIRINCFNGNKTVAIDFFAFTPPENPLFFPSDLQPPSDNPVLEKTSSEEDETDGPDEFEKFPVEKPRQVNVVIFGIDAVSHMNLQRIMPLSYAFLTQNLSAVGMSGYTKVAENTFPNLVPALTGHYSYELGPICWNKTKFFDDSPFIWKKFSEQGYLTGYGEDAVWLGNFYYLKKGFRQPPTNYYYNPMMLEAANKVGHQHHGNSKWCYGSRLSFEILLDFLKKMAFNANKVQRYFQFLWVNALTHDDLNAGNLGDQLLLDTLIWLKDGGYLEDTVFITMSDHGLRYGGIRNTLQGKLEERMPFLYFAFPPWFKERYQSAVSNMKRNSNKLTTHYDLHETLLDLVHLENITSERVRERHFDLVGREERPRGISLFLPVPADRNCKHAAIPDAWCVCRSRKPVTVENNELVQQAAEHAVEFINKLFDPFPQCAKLTLKTIDDAQVFQTQNAKVADTSESITSLKDKRLSKQSVTYSVAFSTSPSDATFEMTTTRETNGTWTTSREISRTNLYGNQSWCVDDYDMRKYCFCD